MTRPHAFTGQALLLFLGALPCAAPAQTCLGYVGNAPEGTPWLAVERWSSKHNTTSGASLGFGHPLFGAVRFTHSSFNDERLSRNDASAGIGFLARSSDSPVVLCPAMSIGVTTGLDQPGNDVSVITLAPGLGWAASSIRSERITLLFIGEAYLVHSRISVNVRRAGTVKDTQNDRAVAIGMSVVYDRKYSIGPMVRLGGIDSWGIHGAVNLGSGRSGLS